MTRKDTFKTERDELVEAVAIGVDPKLSDDRHAPVVAHRLHRTASIGGSSLAPMQMSEKERVRGKSGLRRETERARRPTQARPWGMQAVPPHWASNFGGGPTYIGLLYTYVGKWASPEQIVTSFGRSTPTLSQIAPLLSPTTRPFASLTEHRH